MVTDVTHSFLLYSVGYFFELVKRVRDEPMCIHSKHKVKVALYFVLGPRLLLKMLVSRRNNGTNETNSYREPNIFDAFKS